MNRARRNEIDNFGNRIHNLPDVKSKIIYMSGYVKELLTRVANLEEPVEKGHKELQYSKTDLNYNSIWTSGWHKGYETAEEGMVSVDEILKELDNTMKHLGIYEGKEHKRLREFIVYKGKS